MPRDPGSTAARRLALRLWILGLTMALGGCFTQFEEYRQTTPPERPPGAQPVAGPPPAVFPLVPGARFDYDARFGLGAGLFTGEAVVSVLDAWQLDGKERQHVSVVSRYFGQTHRERYVFVREAGMIGLFEKFPPDQITFFMPTTLAVGQRWKVVTGEGTGEAEVQATEAVKVPAGAFEETWRVRYRNPGARTDLMLWLAPGVGLVKANVRMTVNVLPLVGTLSLERLALPIAKDQPAR